MNNFVTLIKSLKVRGNDLFRATNLLKKQLQHFLLLAKSLIIIKYSYFNGAYSENGATEMVSTADNNHPHEEGSTT